MACAGVRISGDTRDAFSDHANFFQVNRKWRFVDLPGYGFAQVARKDKARFNAAVPGFPKERPIPARVFPLIDP